jgi:hypothetical protein
MNQSQDLYSQIAKGLTEPQITDKDFTDYKDRGIKWEASMPKMTDSEYSLPKTASELLGRLGVISQSQFDETVEMLTPWADKYEALPFTPRKSYRNIGSLALKNVARMKFEIREKFNSAGLYESRVDKADGLLAFFAQSNAPEFTELPETG